MDNLGHIRVFRGLLDSQVFAHQTALKVWIWCLLKASYKTRFVNLKIGKGSTTIKINAGQFIFGRLKAEEELNIDGSAIYRWINKFASEEFDNMISLNVSNQYTIITINKWADYQLQESENEQPMNNQCTANEQPMNTYKKVKKVNKGKEELIDKNALLIKGFKNSILPEFESVFLDWLEYKRKNGKSYKDSKYAELAYKKLFELSGGNADIAKEIVKQSMENSWSGLFELKNKIQQAPKKGVTLDQMKDIYNNLTGRNGYNSNQINVIEQGEYEDLGNKR